MIDEKASIFFARKFWLQSTYTIKLNFFLGLIFVSLLNALALLNIASISIRAARRVITEKC